MEFEAIYTIRDKVLPLLEHFNIEYTELHPKNDMTYDMFERPVIKRSGIKQFGYGWCGGPCRWGTTLKQHALNRHSKGCHIYVGIAADEVRRAERLDNNQSSPIFDAGMTEADCLQYCYDRGFRWDEPGASGSVELYSILDRVSCWCCRNKNLKELRNIYHTLPEYWEKLLYLQERIADPMKGAGASVHQLQKRFDFENERKNHGLSISSRDFYRELKLLD